MTDEAIHPNARMVLTGALVDIDVFADNAVVDYTLADAKGAEHVFAVPADLPFPMALGLTRAYDAIEAVEDQETAEQAHERLCQSLARLLNLRQEVSVETLVRDFGRGRLLALAAAIVLRIQMQASGSGLGDYIERLVNPPREEVPFDQPGSSDSSGVSGSSTAGASITGVESDGRSSGASPTSSTEPPTA